MELASQQKKKLKAIGHSLSPVLTVGQHGLKESIHDEFETAITAHQLIKVKLVGERDDRQAYADTLSKQHNATLVQLIGGKALFYRRNKDKDNLLKGL